MTAKPTLIRLLPSHVGETVQLKGWVYNIRSSGKLRFLQMRDGTGIVQVVWFKGAVDESTFALVDTLTQESSIVVTGKVKAEGRAENGVELDGVSLEVLQIAKDYPLGPKEHGPDFLLSNRHLWLRSRKPNAILRIRDRFAKAVRDFFDQEGFTLIDTPIFTPAACEGTTTLFETEYFGQKAYLSQSGQLYAEAAAMAFGKTYCFGPTFRAEKSKTRRHLTEFWMIEPEVAFNDLNDNMDLAEDFIRYVIKYTLENCADDLKFLEQRLIDEEKNKPQAERSEMALLEKLNFVLENNFIRISYTEAIDILKNSKPNKNKKFQYLIEEWGADLQSEHERYLVEKHFKSPVILFDYPAKIKAFYMRLNEDGQTVRAMDILFPGIGEIVGGSQREEGLDVLIEKMNALGIPEEELWWYLDTRRFGTAIHSGFGLGFERLVLFVTGMTNIRDVIPFPRTPQNAEF